MYEPTPSLHPEQLSEADFEALQEDVRARKHKLGWLLFGLTDSAVAGLWLGLTSTLALVCGWGAYYLSQRGTGAILAGSLVPLAAYGLIALPTWTGIVDVGRSRHPHLYPALLLIGLAVSTLIYWGALFRIT